jgi:hypothetical protein
VGSNPVDAVDLKKTPSCREEVMLGVPYHKILQHVK